MGLRIVLKSLLKPFLKKEIKNNEENNKNLNIHPTSQLYDCNLEDNIKIGCDSIFYSCNIGSFTYFFGYNSGANATVGKYCSIARGVHLGLGMHPSSVFVSTSPVFYLRETPLGISFTDENNFETSKPVKVGNDVWIGVNALIMDGIEIGDGAIIAAGSVVTKNVDPYTIVGGIPAKEIKQRFNDSQIRFLIKFKWWDKDVEWLKNNNKNMANIDLLLTLNT